MELIPDLDIFTVRNQASTTSSRRRHWMAARRKTGSNEIVVSGRLYRGAEPIDVWATVRLAKGPEDSGEAEPATF